MTDQPAITWCTKARCEEVVAMQRARGLSVTTEIIPASEDGGCPDAPEWAHVIRYRKPV
jgi:hypothetical protein